MSSNKNADHVQTLDYSRHGKLRVKSNPGYVHAKGRNLVGVNLSELGACAGNFPLVFIQNPQDQQFILGAMMGLRAGENVYQGDEFWSSTYVPQAVQRHPFVVGFDDRKEDQEELATCLEMDSAFLNEKEGLALYNGENVESDFLRSRQQLLRLLFDGERLTARFIARLRELDLLVPLSIDLLERKGDIRQLTGLHSIDEGKLNQLSAEDLKSLQNDNFLAPCYLILGSLYQLNQLIRLRNRKGGKEQFVNFRLKFGEQAASANAQ
jgi:hypothetical protein